MTHPLFLEKFSSGGLNITNVRAIELENLELLCESSFNETLSINPYGRSICSAGDVNGDGHDEIVFSNSTGIDTTNSVCICRYTGTEVLEKITARRQAGATVLKQNIPSPFTSWTLIRFEVCMLELANSSLDIYDAPSRYVSNL